MPGTLYLVATPIGNLEDLTFRALRVLREAELIAAEDTRHSRKLLGHYGIATPLTSYFAHNEAAKGDRLLAVLQRGGSVALISDAGTPGISDPGFLLVRRCREEGIPVTAVPGPSAVVTAVSISGLPCDRFVFEGFLPARAKARRDRLRHITAEERTVIFYEAPHRLGAALADIARELGGARQVAVARELTKIHEEIFLGSATAAAEHFAAGPVRGEIVLMIGPAPATAEPAAAEPLEAALRRYLAAGLPLRQAVKQAAREYGLPGDEVYRRALAMKE